MMTRRTIIGTCFLVLLLIASSHAEDCEEAKRLTEQALEIGQTGGAAGKMMPLLKRAIDLCPTLASAHSLLAGVFEKEGRWQDALAQYQETARLRPDAANVWTALGRLYDRMQQFPLALEAYLHACPQDPDVRPRIAALLASNLYQVTENGAILDKQSLLLLFDRSRREALNRMLAECRFRSGEDFGSRGIDVEAAVDFPNILFDLGQATLKPESLRQIAEIGAALVEFRDVRVIVNGHTDKQGFQGVTDPAENLRRNLQLSAERAETVKRELMRLDVSPLSIETHGYGPTRPAIDAETEEAYARNRRVVVEVR